MSTKDQSLNRKAEARYAVESSGPKADNPSTTGPGPSKVKSNTPENSLERINPSAPEDANVTPGSIDRK